MKTILLIDDEDDVRTAYMRSLQHHGYRVVGASAAAEGLEIARRDLPDLILSDVNMPGGDGKHLLHQIRQDPELSSRQMVLMTGDPNALTTRRAMELGADDFLVKPISLQALLRCVEARLQRAQTHWRVEDRMLARLRASLRSTLPHEFFTPMAGIMGLSEILLSESAKLPPAEMDELHRDIYQCAQRLHRTLRNYLQIVELDMSAGEETPAAPLLSPQDTLESVKTGVSIAGGRNQRRSDISFEVEKNISVRASVSDLSLIVEELIDNACKFSRKGTPVTVKLDAAGVLSVTDSGRGMSPEEIETIGAFQQFNRRKQEQQGLGLGLVLIQKLSARCGATFSVQSTPSVQTEVKIAFKTA